ncbi:MAG: AbrB/MazE/SpoVT family DNA-binding domain-containing protein [Candidatus Zixiibacteriota bacterium]
MVTKITKWGNSLAIRIPRAFALETELEEGSEIEISIENGIIYLKPVSRTEISLSDLLSKITKDNLHKEIDTGLPQGKEVW